MVFVLNFTHAATTLHVQCGVRSAVRTIGVVLRADVMAVLSVAGCRRAAVSGKSSCCGERYALVVRCATHVAVFVETCVVDRTTVWRMPYHSSAVELRTEI